MGLWLGMSVMTLLQFIEFAMIAVCTHGGTGAVAVLALQGIAVCGGSGVGPASFESWSCGGAVSSV